MKDKEIIIATPHAIIVSPGRTLRYKVVTPYIP